MNWIEKKTLMFLYPLKIHLAVVFYPFSKRGTNSKWCDCRWVAQSHFWRRLPQTQQNNVCSQRLLPHREIAAGDIRDGQHRSSIDDHQQQSIFNVDLSFLSSWYKSVPSPRRLSLPTNHQRQSTAVCLFLVPGCDEKQIVRIRRVQTMERPNHRFFSGCHQKHANKWPKKQKGGSCNRQSMVSCK